METWTWRSVVLIYFLFFVCSVSHSLRPRLISAPTVDSLTSDGATVRWHAWAADSDEGNGTVTGYVVVAREKSTDPNAQFTISIDAGTALSVKVEPLMWEQDYDIAVVCLNSRGDEGDPSPTLSVPIPCGLPTVAPILESLVTVDETSLRLTWTNPPQSSWRCSNLDDMMIAYEYTDGTFTDEQTYSNSLKAPIMDGQLIIGDLKACLTYDIISYMYDSTSMEYSNLVSNILNGTMDIGTVGPVGTVNAFGQSDLGEPNFILSWSKPISSCQPDNYTITYAVIKRLACPDPVETKDIKEIEGIKVTTYLLQKLEYYARYEINITGINALGPGTTVPYNEGETFDGEPISTPVPALQRDLAAPGELHFNWTVACEEIHGLFRRYRFELYYETELVDHGQNGRFGKRQAHFTGLDGCTEYQFRVRITNAHSAGPFNQFMAAVTPTVAPGFILNLMASSPVDTPTSLSVTWEPDMSAQCPAELYHLEYTLNVRDRCDDVDSSPVAVSPMSGQSFLVEGLEPYSEYAVSVYTSNSGGISSKVEKVVFTGEKAPTGAPGDVKAFTVEYNKLEFTFSQLVCGTRHGVIKMYHYQLREVASGMVTNGTTDMIQVTLVNLSRKSEYGIKIRAENSAGFGNFSKEVLQYTAVGLPTEPMNLATYDNPSASVPLTWQPPVKPNGDISRYEIQYWESSMDTSKSTSLEFTDVDASNLRLLISDLEPLKEYSFRIRATNEAGIGNWSSIFTQEIGEGAPGPVVGLMVTGVTTDSISIEWSAPLDPKGVVSKYTIQNAVTNRPYREETDNEMKKPSVIISDKMSYTITDLDPATEYVIQVSAHTSSEEGELSTVKQYTDVPEDIPAPTDVLLESAVVSDDGRLVVKLPPITYEYATGYQIGVHCKDFDYEPTFLDDGKNATKCSYIAGEVSKENDKFVIGDGKMYGSYENVPLMKDKEYDIYVSIVTRTTGGSVVSWAADPLKAEQKSSGSLVVLWIILVLLLLIILVAIVSWRAFLHQQKKDNKKKSPLPEENVLME